ncbi:MULTISPECIES: Hsp33 family molecular chaperone HslO [Pseudomonas]|jgi:Disulfide bond chaperones of the HSP33 family|uniref:33 kDa chaperonin n=1 Tax=Pseudomonas brassicacearum (strain NFM421) TaxID=994484 RepID=F2KAR9_PSEBN|nr:MULTISPECIES: Hsp33 family molecular chaperone HslO [Pseudomonas]EIK69795.1 chaperonin HslO [Pseudomonas fluorescens Q8r1-96]KIR18780.1 33 kDa chaperonin [Pseudomonas fluorescens]AEA66421.1 Putative Heat shock protein 33 [Pseudomonas brassicacearum subsp. brassicacearum NFM421]ALQ00858.1 33 kDa chaperonin (Heat shock protein 33) (HSP33) [Pseudomonas brassicacearum]AOS39984.1 molecular chaperone Hsp33 [Pseudomonas brassicacearum]
MTDLPDTDYTQRFIFDDSDARGELVALERSYAEVLAKHAYPEPVAQLLGELMAAAALLVGTLKFDGLLILQARSEGPVPLLMIECSSEREIRGLARYHAEQIAPDATLADMMPDGVLALTVDPTHGKRYQGIVDLDGATLAECFTNYFVMSQQTNTRFWLYADGRRARGLLLQQLPADRLRDAEERDASWQHINALASTLSADELLSLDNETVLHRLYHEEQVRLFDGQPLRFQCSCSRERSANALVSLGLEDAQQLVIEHGGAIEIDCQFCNERYLFDAADIAQLFAGAGVDTPSDTRH